MKQTYRIMTDHTEPSDAEAARWQNFDQLLGDYHAARRQRQRWWSGSLVGLTLLIAGWGIWTYWPSTTPTAPSRRVVVHAPSLAEPLLPPVLRPVVPVAVPSVPPVSSADKPSRAAVQSSDSETFVEAVPAGGYPVLYDYFAQQLRYPEAARQAKVSGTVLTEFTIDTLGQPTNVRVVRGVCDDLNQEAIRLIRQMPHWTPASVGTKPVATKHTMPLHFQLTNP